jgi:8-oxo-dGTP pyrophosphatase MutT (NUDIX family)
MQPTNVDSGAGQPVGRVPGVAGVGASGANGPRLRSDVVDVYVFRRVGTCGAEFLQLRRAKPPMEDTWQPVMGHIEPGENAVAAALREAAEEIGLLQADPAFVGLWALEQVWPYYLPSSNSIMLSPRLVIEVAASFEPTLNHEHKAHRWVGSEVPCELMDEAARHVGSHFTWTGQRHAIAEIFRTILHSDGLHSDGRHMKLNRRATW